MLASVYNLIDDSARRLKLSDQQRRLIITPNVVHEFTITLDNGKSFKAYRSQHNNDRGPYKGGIRFHPHVSRDEVLALSILMSLKTALVGIPLGGGKGGIAVDPRQLTQDELEELSRKYVRALAPHIGPEKDIPAPDVQTNAQVIDWMVDEYSLITGDTSRASFTGKSLNNGGSDGREEATGRGGYIVAKAVLASNGMHDVSYALQGIGNVGSYFAIAAETYEPTWRCIAAADSKSAIYKERIIVSELLRYKKNNHTIATYPDASNISQFDLIATECDMLVLAALGGVVTDKNAQSVRSKYIIELANGPVNDDALTILEKNGVQVIPDILANAGGVVVSYYEWLQNTRTEKWTHEKVLKELDSTMLSATNDVLEHAKREQLTLKQAALDVAILNLMHLR